MDQSTKELDLEKLDAERETARREKEELFDLYHKNWDTLIAELKRHRAAKERRKRDKEEGLI